jgi:Transposase and inactivated derivatives
MDKDNLNHARTCVYNVNYHIVWSVKYRKAVLKGGIDEYLKDTLLQIAADKGFTIHTMEVMPDHVHLFASAHPKLSPSYIVKMLKGISGRMLLMKHPELRKQLWKGHLWNSSFYLETIGSVSEEAIKKYIEHQKTRG